MLIFQLARKVWWYESPFPISAIGYAIEPLYLMGYRHTPAFTISRSTELDLRRLGFKGAITLIPIGVEKVASAPRAKADTPTFLYVGRLAPSKRIVHMLDALAQFRKVTGIGTLWLVGSGSDGYKRSLVKRAHRMNLEASVVFWGQVSSHEKHCLMTEAHALLMTSVREGWGLVVTEANACGTPAIVYDVPGLRDSVRDESTGLVVPPKPGCLADAMIRVTSDPSLYARLAAEAQLWSGTFSFDEAARLVGLALQGTLAA
jgi:glycosyltransferase involved in cell wall biosynthesis